MKMGLIKKKFKKYLREGDSVKLIVGLGNPGREYENTRHNIGFYYLDLIAKELNVSEFKEKFNGSYQKVKYKNEDIIFLKPLSYMNLSGEVVIKFANYFKVKPEDILVIHDDLDLEVSRLKLRPNGSSGGHNGIKNIILNLGSENFKRLKIGIGKDNKFDTKDYVLSKLSSEELLCYKKLEPIVLNIFNDYLTIPFSDLMSRYNRRDLND